MLSDWASRRWEFLPGDVIHKKGTGGSTVVGPCDGPERLLPSLITGKPMSTWAVLIDTGGCGFCFLKKINPMPACEGEPIPWLWGGGRKGDPTHRVPDLKFDLLLVDGDHAGTELNSNREVCDCRGKR